MMSASSGSDHDWSLVSVIVITAAVSAIGFLVYLRVTNTTDSSFLQYQPLLVGLAEVAVTGVLTYVIIRIYRQQTGLLDTQTELLDTQTKLFHASHEPILTVDYEPRKTKPLEGEEEEGDPGDYLWLAIENHGNEVATDLSISFHYHVGGDGATEESWKPMVKPLAFVGRRVLTSQSDGAVIAPEMDETEFRTEVQLEVNGDKRNFRDFFAAFDETHSPLYFWMVLHFQNAANQSYHILVDPPMVWETPIAARTFSEAFVPGHDIEIDELREIVGDPEVAGLPQFSPDPD